LWGLLFIAMVGQEEGQTGLVEEKLAFHATVGQEGYRLGIVLHIMPYARAGGGEVEDRVVQSQECLIRAGGG